MTRLLRRTWNRLLGSFRPNKDGDLGEEIESHLRMLVEEDVRRGIAPAEAYRRARLQFGSVESAKESYRDQRGLPLLDTLAQDLRYAFRGIRNNPGFATVAILSLAIGIGANTAIFSLVNGVLLQPLGYREPQRLFDVSEVAGPLNNGSVMPVNPMHARAWAENCRSLAGVALVRRNRADLADAGSEPASISGVDVPHNIFALLGVEPILGRTFFADEEQEGNHRVAVLSESLWRSRFNADPALVGRTILLDGEKNLVVGILPLRFRLPYAAFNGEPFEIFRPLMLTQREQARLNGNFNYAAVLRLKPGVTVEQAVADINVVEAARFAPLMGRQTELRVALKPVHDLVTGRAQLGLWMLAAAVGAVLLIVCINLANLLLSRIASRSRENAIRTALGASRGRQFRTVLTESLVLAVTGGALGVLLATWCIQLLVASTSLELPRLHEVGLDSAVLLFAVCLTLLTGIIFGALPAWWLTRADPQEALRAGSHTVTEGRRGLRVREALITLEVGLSATLLIVAGLLGTSLTRLLGVEKGFDAAHVVTVDFSLGGSLYRDPLHREKTFGRLLAGLSTIPGARASGFITALPMRGDSIWTDPIYLTGEPSERRHSVNNRYASPGYFSALNIAIRSGRAFDESDRGHGVAVLSDKAAKLLWPNEPNPVGRVFIGEDGKPQTLIGIAAEVRGVLQNDPPPTAYYPYWQRAPGGGTLVVRTTNDPLLAVGAVRASIHSVDAQLPIRTIRTMDEVVDSSVAERKFQVMLVTVFAASALLVASLGIYGVVAYSVARRRNEIGIRMVLGAERSRLLAQVIRQGTAPVAIGLAGGVTVALLLGSAIRGLLFGIQPTDPVTIAGVTLVLLTVGILACIIPAHRAAGTNAVDALRFE